ncbi:MAG TPA: glycerophosphodiester phosphodiesterase family protein [bacterium]|nr:glycerophosphodiester phosphodiesterase family protein [bacterium]
MNWTTSKPLVIAHRGDTKAGLENTLPAIESALKLAIDGIEVDLQLTRDERVVLFHDDDLQRLADRRGNVREFTLSQLKAFRLQQGGFIPTLEELLDLVRDRVLLNLEIKTRPHWYAPGDGRLEVKIAETLRKFSLGDSILLSSFHPLPLWRMRRLAPRLRRGVLFESKYWMHRMALPLTRPFSINAPLAHATQALVQAAHDAGRRFLVWTVNAEDDMRKCLEAGVDGIITDEPRRLKTLLLHRPSGG